MKTNSEVYLSFGPMNDNLPLILQKVLKLNNQAEKNTELRATMSKTSIKANHYFIYIVHLPKSHETEEIELATTFKIRIKNETN